MPELIILKMNTVSFDENLNCTIRVPAASTNSTNISFLINPLFSTSAEGLKAEIAYCHDDCLKHRLERFQKDLEAGRFPFLTDDGNRQEGEADAVTANRGHDVEFIDDSRGDGGWMATVHDVRAEHTGFWYAAMNIPREIQRIKEHIHILQGYIIFLEHVNELVSIIKRSDCHENAFNEVLGYGFTEKQAHAVLDCRLTLLAQLDANQLAEEISNCNNLVEILEKYATTDI